MGDVGYEELASHQRDDGPHGSFVRRTAGSVAVPVIDLAEPPAAPPPPPRSPGRRTALVAAVVVAGAVALVVQHSSGSPAAPTPRADFPSAQPTTPRRSPSLSSSTDLTTVVTRAQLHLATAPTGAEVEAIRAHFDGVELGASYGFRASDPAQGDLGPGEVALSGAVPTDWVVTEAGTGVSIFFAGRISSRAVFALGRLLGNFRPARGWTIAQVPGTTVDIAVPFVPGPHSCVDADGVVTDRGLQAPSTVLPFYGLRVVGDRLVIGYTGPLLSSDGLSAVGRRLARSCDQPATAVSYTRSTT